MIPYDLDPSLHTAEPERMLLDDGFSPPQPVFMATHPVEDEPAAPGPDPLEPNPTRLPVEPEFGPQLPPAEPEDPGVKPPTV